MQRPWTVREDEELDEETRLTKSALGQHLEVLLLTLHTFPRKMGCSESGLSSEVVEEKRLTKSALGQHLPATSRQFTRPASRV